MANKKMKMKKKENPYRKPLALQFGGWVWGQQPHPVKLSSYGNRNYERS